MATFKNLEELQKHLEDNIMEITRSSMGLERVLAEFMRDAVISRVYESYQSSEAEMAKRRGDSGGLSDTRNMVIQDVVILSGGKVKIIFENIAEGRDSMRGDYLVDAFEDPEVSGRWGKLGEWSEDRDFINATADSIRQNPSEVVNAIKQDLREYGFKVK